MRAPAPAAGSASDLTRGCRLPPSNQSAAERNDTPPPAAVSTSRGARRPPNICRSQARTPADRAQQGAASLQIGREGPWDNLSKKLWVQRCPAGNHLPGINPARPAFPPRSEAAFDLRPSALLLLPSAAHLTLPLTLSHT